MIHFNRNVYYEREGGGAGRQITSCARQSLEKEAGNRNRREQNPSIVTKQEWNPA
jgi:hypothetical protein